MCQLPADRLARQGTAAAAVGVLLLPLLLALLLLPDHLLQLGQDGCAPLEFRALVAQQLHAAHGLFTQLTPVERLGLAISTRIWRRPLRRSRCFQAAIGKHVCFILQASFSHSAHSSSSIQVQTHRVVQVQACQLAEAVEALGPTQHAVVCKAEVEGDLIQPAHAQEHAGKMQERCMKRATEHAGNTRENTQETCWKDAGNVQETCGKHA